MGFVETNIPGTQLEPDVLETLMLSQHSSWSDNSRRLVQTSDDRTQSALYLSDHTYARVDNTGNELDTDDDCKQSYSARDTELIANFNQHSFACEVCCRKFVHVRQYKTRMMIHMTKRAVSSNVCGKISTCSSDLRTHLCVFTCEKLLVWSETRTGEA